jgi:hypothetical protein
LQGVTERSGSRVENVLALFSKDLGHHLGGVDLGRFLAPAELTRTKVSSRFSMIMFGDLNSPDDQTTLALAGHIECVSLLQKVDVLLQDIQVDSVLGRVTKNSTDLIC